MSELVIRHARPGDRDDVFSISATVWEGNDYVPSVWDSWIAQHEAEGMLLVGELEGRVVAIQHLEFQPGDVVWLEGIRVHRDFRGRGFAARLLADALERIAAGRFRVARLSTSSENEASMSVVRRAGFRELARYHAFTAPALEDSAPTQGVEPTSPSDADLERARRLIGQPDTLQVVAGWTVMDVPQQMAVTDFPVALKVNSSDSFGLTLGSERRQRNRLAMAFIGGDAEAIALLGREMRRLAHRRELEAVNGMLRRTPQVEDGLNRAGYELRDEHSMLLFERSLR
ncbi:MAG TPA: GNAT family N-acetyltransferase [Chloroflexota bacterium]|nr:GNAT family N-acetyltransferase [Chloroflexota bacterium]